MITIKSRIKIKNSDSTPNYLAQLSFGDYNIRSFK